MNLFQQTLALKNTSGTPPIWMMRQAGRYHAHYQNLRKTYSFLDLCRNTQASAEAAMGPIEDFDFDAAILFSDILFPIEAMGVSLDFNPAPSFGRLLTSKTDLQHYQPTQDPQDFFGFQADALCELRRRLPASKGLIGFVGGLATLYQFACMGSGKIKAPIDDRFDGFMEKLVPLLAENMSVQAAAGIDCMAVLDSSADIVSLAEFNMRYFPYLQELLRLFRAKHPTMPVLYYSKNMPAKIWDDLRPLSLQGIGVDHSHELISVLQSQHDRYAIQGNVPPEWMNDPWSVTEPKLRAWFESVKALPADARKGWICGLGHGLQPTAREENVREFVRLAREVFA
jgi:uroporphyrinogen decarboxylase